MRGAVFRMSKRSCGTTNVSKETYMIQMRPDSNEIHVSKETFITQMIPNSNETYVSMRPTSFISVQGTVLQTNETYVLKETYITQMRPNSNETYVSIKTYIIHLSARNCPSECRNVLGFRVYGPAVR